MNNSGRTTKIRILNTRLNICFAISGSKNAEARRAHAVLAFWLILDPGKDQYRMKHIKYVKVRRVLGITKDDQGPVTEVWPA